MKRPGFLKIELIESEGRKSEFYVPIGSEETLLELIEKEGGSSPFGCRVGSCGTCVVSVLIGAECLQPPQGLEGRTLDNVAPGLKEARLFCRAKIKDNLNSDEELIVRKIKIE